MFKRHFAKMEAMRRAADHLTCLPMIGRDVFLRGEPERLVTTTRRPATATLFDLTHAYGQVTARFNETMRRHYEAEERMSR